ncbi:hypothetical protein LCGC14_2099210, partial [marine sediment metagenome]
MATPNQSSQSGDFALFREWVQSTYGSDADSIIRQAVEDSFKPGGLEENNDIFQAWVRIGRPSAESTPQRQEEQRQAIVEQMRASLAATGQLPFSEFGEQAPFLEARGFERVTEGPFGFPLSEEEQFFRQGVTAPTPEEASAEQFDAQMANAQRIADVTGASMEDVFASLTGTPTAPPAGAIGLTPAQEEQQRQANQQFGLQTAQFEFQQRKLAQDQRNALLGNQIAQASQGQIARAQLSESQIRQQEQANFAKQFEEFRRQVLSGTAPRGFFTRQALSSAPNPFAPFGIGQRPISEDIDEVKNE